MRNLVFSLISLLVITSAVNAETPKKPSPELRSAISQIRKLNASDFTALKSWLSGKGRQALREKGLTDADIGGLRLDTDQWNDAPLGE